ncbi:MAG: hypothetical protein ACLTD2_00850 [Ruminococcus sp.]
MVTLSRQFVFRTSTERPEALEAGDFILAELQRKNCSMLRNVAIEMKQKGVLGKPCPDYVDETSINESRKDHSGIC